LLSLMNLVVEVSGPRSLAHRPRRGPSAHTTVVGLGTKTGGMGECQITPFLAHRTRRQVPCSEEEKGGEV
jgi:hypothetical protein